ncbi:biotin-dependent carboxyltransferase [Bacillus sp. RG28]|uniref:Biotin-dependent carboxyltransferase n=1 Tax=Gottfriedia endophytica TaxID=2820819 RepID=A0A940NSG2_9BACI|nr:biotin-dependent carboxyltransferase family protein [Gottfriedia endophytica]MBP0726990.1 biotin-dependent carboxyltransferase [Gottfriedia endophytica]
MKFPLFQIEKDGLLLSLQDLGREGMRHQGIPCSGAMDSFSLRIGNILVGNHYSCAGLEVTMGGCILRVLKDTTIIVTGANLTPKLNNKDLPMWKTISLKKGDQIAFLGPKSGLRSYICVYGGFEEEFVLNSVSYYDKANLGRKLEKGSTIFAKLNSTNPKKIGLRSNLIPNYHKRVKVRVIQSPHINRFSQETIQFFFSTVFQVSSSDRMGMYLTNDLPVIQEDNSGMLSEGVTYGTIQILPNGSPIILLADAQTTGGYPTIGTVISVDLWKLAQIQTGGSIEFIPIDIYEAQRLFFEMEKKLRVIQIEYNNIM